MDLHAGQININKTVYLVTNNGSKAFFFLEIQKRKAKDSTISDEKILITIILFLLEESRNKFANPGRQN